MDDKIVTVTRDGRTIVDANQLFQDEEVKSFIDSIKKTYEGGAAVMRRRYTARNRRNRSALVRRLNAARS
jgi:hypothetical protein